MGRLSSPFNTHLPQATAMRLLRIMLSIALVPTLIVFFAAWTTAGLEFATIFLGMLWPIGAAWVFVMLPGLERRLGNRYLPVALVVTIVAQTLESSLIGFANPPGDFRFRSLAVARFVPVFSMRLTEPLFLLLVAVVLAAWVYGRRGAWLSAGLSGLLLIIGSIMNDLVMPDLSRPGELLLGAISPWSIISVMILRLPLLIVIGYIVGTLAEQERQQAAALSVANARLREQASAAEDLATARERNRLARDLHDTLAHSLAGLVVQLEAIEMLVKTEPELAIAEVAKARQLAHTGLQEARQAIRDLRANPIEDLGLARALEREALDFGERTGVQLDLCVTDPQPSLPNDKAAQMLWIAQEAFHNIECHADAQCVTIALLQADDQLTLRIADDGHGFAAEQVGENSFGLTGMRERAEMLGGQLCVNSAVNQGTQVEFDMRHAA